MTADDRKLIDRAIATSTQVSVYYNHPEKKGPVTRHIRPYERSINNAGRAVVWATDSIHGPRQIHAFREDRILTVSVAKDPQSFRPATSITRHLVSYGRVLDHPIRR